MKYALKTAKIVVTVLLFIILSVILVQRITKNNFSIAGFRIFTIISQSMEPDYRIGDILISKSVKAADIRVGDRVTYLGKEGEMRGLIVTHEVTYIRNEDGKYYFTTIGLANNIPDPEISENDIYGRIIYRTRIFSFFGRIMQNAIVYFSLFVVISLFFSYQIVSRFILNKTEN